MDKYLRIHILGNRWQRVAKFILELLYPQETASVTTKIACYYGELKPVVYILTATPAIRTNELLRSSGR
jgi:hypothetical protein